ncbi:glycoside hydrolase family 2 protein [Thalassoroseus pseudoceratinae]|uniref:glycoside hydrolase family 2 protein n=1 Tax=Thalassoroseus pseudoceratinae TaxID=2713176 RepID=UPI00141E77D0|nr:sugar-binding domain-containing protein [Thalassoroseus pseudoceratinae]
MRRIGTYALLNVLLSTLTAQAQAQEVVDDWKYTVRRPIDSWKAVAFNDSAWKDGAGGFGTVGTPGARIGTTWSTKNIWLRKTFKLKDIPTEPALLIHHDENTQVFINGEQVASFDGYVTQYKLVPLANNKHDVLRKGKNVMAVHCRQTGGGQFIDVHLVDGKNVPKLPQPKRNTKPFQSDLITKCGAEVTPENAWTEYPRPQMERRNWTNLNGHWDYAITKIEQREAPDTWTGKILVPFSLESKLGGVQRLLDSSEALWYRRSFECDKSSRKRQLLNFEAVDYRCEVFVNGTSVGKHTGGNTPFSFDITAAVRDGANELVVRVEDATEQWQLRGKQVLNARGIWYTQVSGIWQTVWLEEVPRLYISDLKIKTNAEHGSIGVEPNIEGNRADTKLRLRILDGDTVKHDSKASNAGSFLIAITDPKLWSPASPHLYDVELSLVTARGEVIDQVKSYAGIRTVGKTLDADGHLRFTLNGEIIFHWGPLDQGWWPDGLLTPPSDEAMLFDIEWLRQAGFNMIRKHIKVEPRRYYYHCDRLGMMVWQDQVSGGKNWPKWTRLQPNPTDSEWPAEQHKQFMSELEAMIDSLENHPSIVVWVPFNEAWGQHKTVEVGQWTAKRDPSRLVNVASGGNFWPAGDIVDHHSYPHPSFPFDLNKGNRFDDYIKVVGEFGGHGFPVHQHLWDADRRNWGYGELPKTIDEYKERYVTSLKMLRDLQQQGIAGAVYTQTTDVEGEINGLMTYDRKVIKISARELAELHKMLMETDEE